VLYMMYEPRKKSTAAEKFKRTGIPMNLNHTAHHLLTKTKTKTDIKGIRKPQDLQVFISGRVAGN
jgi:hypothetical protein